VADTAVNKDYHMNEVTLRILRTSEELFLRHGFSRITVEEIARELEMSKKTIYKYFKNKKSIIRQVITWNQAELMDKIDRVLLQDNTDFIEKLRSILQVLTSFLSKISETFVTDLKRHGPEIWGLINEFKKKMRSERVRRILHEGIEKGIIRADIDPELIVIIYFHIVEHLFIPENLYELSYSSKDIFEAVMKIIYGGILTESGRSSFLKGGYDENKQKT
jgi:AcrR family transcriptional regulator